MDPTRFIRHGYLPKELPPLFTSRSLGNAVRKNPPTLPAATARLAWTPMLYHHLGRPSGVHRILGVPHPANYVVACQRLAAEWNRAKRVIDKSPYSSSKPTLKPRNQRAAGPAKSREDWLTARASVRAQAKYIVIADVAEFYRSVYTHSVPWALIGRENTKRLIKQNASLPPARRTLIPGDPIDRALQAQQDGQTNGIPAGPDLSYVIGELILSAADRHLVTALPERPGVRYFDDYEIGCLDRGDADRTLSVISQTLEQFGLQLNPRKTRVVELPLGIQEDRTLWVKSLRDSPSRDELIEFFDKVFEHRRTHPDSNVTSYALSRIAESSPRAELWPLLQSFMSQAVLADPSATNQFARALVRLFAQHGYTPLADQFGATLRALIVDGLSRGCGNQVAWALWSALAFDVDIREMGTLLSDQCTDPFALLLALQANRRGLLGRGFDTSTWVDWMTADHLHTSRWLVAYEGYESNLLPRTGADYIASDPFFAWARNQRVRFMKRFRAISRRTARSLYDEMFPEHEDYDGDTIDF